MILKPLVLLAAGLVFLCAAAYARGDQHKRLVRGEADAARICRLASIAFFATACLHIVHAVAVAFGVWP